jgi:hypothetical protein
MLGQLKKLFNLNKPVEEKSEPLPVKQNSKVQRKKKEKKPDPVLSEKERATAAGEPYVSILTVDIDPSNINAGSFELDWNDKFIINLIKAGYKQRVDDTDQVVVDRWFQTVCRNIALEVYEQQIADPTNRDVEEIRRIHTKDIGNGRSEIS